jgi:hypothetical protein
VSHEEQFIDAACLSPRFDFDPGVLGCGLDIWNFSLRNLFGAGHRRGAVAGLRFGAAGNAAVTDRRLLSMPGFVTLQCDARVTLQCDMRRLFRDFSQFSPPR